jgi:hypothetical protein
MRRSIAIFLSAVMAMSSGAPAARAQSTSLVGGGVVALPSETAGPNLVQNPGFESAGPAGWSGGGGWSLDQLQKHGGSFSFRRDSGGTVSQTFQLKAGTYKASAWVKTQNLGSGSTSGLRLTLDQRPGGLNAWTPSDVVSGTNDWTRVDIGPVVVDADRTAALLLEMYNAPSGAAWFDDITLTKMDSGAIDAFLLYPNFRGMLFDDGPSTMKFDVETSPPGGDFSRYGVTATLKDETSGQVVATQSYAAADHFVADLDGSGMQVGRSYVVTLSLVDKSASNAVVSSYPPYRVSKVSAATRQSMNVAFDANNRFLIKGRQRFILGVYDSGMGYSADPAFWDNALWSATGDRRMGGLNINMYLNYWYGEAPADAMKALMSNLQSHGVTYLQTGNCFNNVPAGNNFNINKSDAYVQDLAVQPGLAGFYTIDECQPSLVPGAFSQYDRLRRLAPGTITFMANFGDGNLSLWKDATDVVATDPYPLFGAEPSGGYNHKQVADWTAAARTVVGDARPIMTVLQFFKFTSQGRFPTLQEMRSHAYMAIVEGAQGLFWWSLGDNALLAVCSGWCDERTGYMNNLKSVVNEIATLEAALLANDAASALTQNSNTAIKTKVKVIGGKGYVFAYNSTNTNQNASFTWNTAPGAVTVNAENRTIAASGNTFSDTFGPYAAHVYVIGNGGSGSGSSNTPPPSSGGTSNPGTSTPGTSTPGTSTPGTSTPGTSTPGTSTPGTSTPGTSTPGTSNPGTPTQTGTLKVVVTQPTGGSTVSNSAWAVMWLEGSTAATKTYSLTLGGKAMGSTTTSSNGPVSLPYDTKMVVDGTQPLVATVKDSSNKTGSSTVNINVKNGITTAPTTGDTSTGGTSGGATSGSGTSTGASGSGTTGSGTTGTGTAGSSTTGTGTAGSSTTGTGTTGSSTTGTGTTGSGTTGSGTTGSSTTSGGATSNPAPAPTGSIKVSVTQPSAGSTVRGTVWVTIWLDNAAAGNKTYTLTAGGKTVWTQTSGDRPTTVPWNTTLNANGAATLTVGVKDSAGNTGSSSLNLSVAN